jgi:predicted adenylyl cyclase CyaB
MACNIEIKAEARNFEKQSELAASLAHGDPERLMQVDTFFRVSSGRLKLREFADGTAELIQYERPDAIEPTACNYLRYSADNPGLLKKVLSGALGLRAVVRKERTVYMVGRTRVHLDRVEGLGEYIELEVVLDTDTTAEEGVNFAHELMEKLEIHGEDLVEVSYVDMLEGKPGRECW